MAQKTIAALFDNVEDAARAIRHLHTADIEPLEVSIVVSDPDSRCLDYLERSSHRDQDDGDVKVGAILGSILGVGAGLRGRGPSRRHSRRGAYRRDKYRAGRPNPRPGRRD